MKALILYFSGTGNTRYIAQKIQAELELNEIATEIHSIEEKFVVRPNTYDYLVLGCPKYYEYPALNFIEYVKGYLPVSEKTVPVILFCTQTGPLETDFSKIEKALASKNHKLLISKSIPLANNFLIMKRFKQTDKNEAKKRVKVAKKLAKKMVEDLLTNNPSKEEIGKFKGGMEHFVAVSCDKLFPVFAMKYSVSAQCTKCGKCAKACPQQNIIMGSEPEFGKHCMFCMRCINECPSHAILYKGRSIPQYHLPKAD